jgi:hypothetical protein
MSKELNNLKQYEEGLRKGPFADKPQVLDTVQLQLPKEDVSND